MEGDSQELDDDTNDERLVRRVLAELRAAYRREKDWRRASKEVYSKYANESRGMLGGSAGAFNILYSNTETLLSALYNGSPRPDVRRRYDRDDPVGNVVSVILQRAIQFLVDEDGYDRRLQCAVLDALLCGRGVVRVRYVPSFIQVAGVPLQSVPSDPDEYEKDIQHESWEGPFEELDWEQAPVEHVYWESFFHGPGNSWDQVQWIAFHHRMTREELVETFGEEVGKEIPLDASSERGPGIGESEERQIDMYSATGQGGTKNYADIYEFWDKHERKVYWVSQAVKHRALKVEDDYLRLDGFYPVPRPMIYIQRSDSLLPIPPYYMYKKQADELDEISIRIINLIQAIKARGVYDASIREIGTLFNYGDNQLIPSENLQTLLALNGKLDSAILWAPIEQLTKVLVELYREREAAKQVIYEITGIADIIRGNTKAVETARAQSIKARFVTLRLSQAQTSVEYFVRSVLRLQGEVIATHFQPETLLQMTSVQVPSTQEIQQQALLAQQGLAEPPPPDVVTVEQVFAVLRDDVYRAFKIDIESESLTREMEDSDVTELSQLLFGITQFMSGIAPFVEQGVVPFDTAKAMILAVVRRARLGSAVEQSLNQLQPPQPQNPAPVDPSTTPEGIKMHTELLKQQAETERVQFKEQAQNQRALLEANTELSIGRPVGAY